VPVRVRIRRLTGLKAGQAVERRFIRRVQALMRHAPGSPKAAREKSEIEHMLLQLLTGEGLRVTERVVNGLGRVGLAVVPGRPGKGWREWTWLSDDRRRELTIRVWNAPALRAASLHWLEVPVVMRNARESARDERHQAFYAAYESIGAKAYGAKPPRLNTRDRTILLVGEFEADVNNGGFSQYLSNKGRVRAGAGLRALKSIGAKHSAGLLEAALKPGVSKAALSRLDERFYAKGEDLAGLAVRAAGPTALPSIVSGE
jgi:hypothetical protein